MWAEAPAEFNLAAHQICEPSLIVAAVSYACALATKSRMKIQARPEAVFGVKKVAPISAGHFLAAAALRASVRVFCISSTGASWPVNSLNWSAAWPTNICRAGMSMGGKCELVQAELNMAGRVSLTQQQLPQKFSTLSLSTPTTPHLQPVDHQAIVVPRIFEQLRPDRSVHAVKHQAEVLDGGGGHRRLLRLHTERDRAVCVAMRELCQGVAEQATIALELRLAA